jgi:hypothetical protein
MEWEEFTMPSTLVLGPWKRYRRRVDNVKLEARLIEWQGTKYLEVRESRGEDFCCPYCSTLLSQKNGGRVPPALLETKIFHERHEPLDKN